MCPATEKYLTPYIDKNRLPIWIDGRVAADVEKNARSVLAPTRIQMNDKKAHLLEQ